MVRKILSSAELTALGFGSRTTIWRRSRDPDDPFPAPVEVGPNKAGFFADEMQAYQESLRRRGPDKSAATTTELKPDIANAEQSETSPP